MSVSKGSHKVVRFYSDFAEKYDRRWRNYLKATLGVALEAIAPAGRERILDVACGTGELERMILERFPSQPVVGIDITEAMLEFARDKCANFPNVKFHQGDSASLMFNSGQFDVVVSCSALHYMREGERFFREAHRVLAPGGRIIIIDWCRDFFFAKLYDLISKIYKRAHHKVYSKSEIISLLENSGFSITKFHTFHVKPYWWMMCVEGRKGRVKWGNGKWEMS